ncbi:MAG: hypothetical protein K6F68_06780 [Clostridiales bacterium]|nr:hypothetical protein [Clostridiales bacterium]
MSDEKLKIEEEIMTDEPLSEEEEAELDRLLKMTAEEDDAKVDYGAIHDAVIERARGEGIAIFPVSKAEKRKKAVRRVLAGVGTAAAVFAIGFFALSVIKQNFPFLGSRVNHAAPQADSGNDNKEAYASFAPATDAPVISFPAAHTHIPPVVTEVPETPGPTAPTKGDVLKTPLPTEYFVENTKVGYLLVCPFTIDPVDSPELLPELPEYFETEVLDTELCACAYGEKDGKECYYKCFASKYLYPDAAIGVGVARMTVEEDEGLIHFTWRVTETCWLEVYFEGFTEAEAIALLKTLPLCDLNAFGEAA